MDTTPSTTDKNTITVYIGIYNGKQYLDSLLAQMKNQISQKFNILMVDNNSIDGFEENLVKWQTAFGDRFVYLRNEVNLGGAGSISRNIHLVNTGWITFVHQDDVYHPNHIQVLLAQLSTASDETLAVTTDMGSMKHEGIIQASPLRPSWIAGKYSRFDLFLLNLRVQTVPWPSTAFRTKSLIENLAPWHTTFFDVETTLNLIMSGDIKFVHTETMLYRENLYGESKSITSMESLLSSFLGISRIINSGKFLDFISNMPLEINYEYLISIIQAIKTRIGINLYSMVIIIQIIEIISKSTKYRDRKINRMLSSIYELHSSKFTTSLLDGLSTDLTGGEIDIFKILDPAIMEHLLGVNSRNEIYQTIDRSKIKLCLRKISDFLPNLFYKKLAVYFLKLRLLSNKKHPWNIK